MADYTSIYSGEQIDQGVGRGLIAARQYAVMPSPAAAYADAIVQYVGATGTYTNGYWYKCILQNGGYVWLEIAGSGGGSGITVLGYYADYAALAAAVTSPSAGDAYGVGTSDPYNIYVWDDVSSAWKDNGTLQGAAGKYQTSVFSVDVTTGVLSVTQSWLDGS